MESGRSIGRKHIQNTTNSAIPKRFAIRRFDRFWYVVCCHFARADEKSPDMLNSSVHRKMNGAWPHGLLLYVAALFNAISSLAQMPRCEWAVQAHGHGGLNDFAWAVAANTNGDLYLGGSFSSTTISFDNCTLKKLGDGWPMYLVKYDRSGHVLWARQSGAQSSAAVTACATLSDGGVLAVGGFATNFILEGHALTNIGQGNTFLARFSPAGELIWLKSCGGSALDFANGIGTDTNDNSYIVGRLGSTNAIFGPFTLSNSQSNGSDAFFAKYDCNGNVLWARAIQGINAMATVRIATDPSGSSYVTGSIDDTCDLGDNVVLTNSSRDCLHAFVARFDPAGKALWATDIQGAGWTIDRAVAIDPQDGCFIAGKCGGSNISVGSRSVNCEHTPGAFAAKFDSTGGLRWLVGLPLEQGFTPHSLAVDEKSRCYIGFDSVFLIARLRADGTLDWTNVVTDGHIRNLGDIVVSPVSGGRLLLAGNFYPKSVRHPECRLFDNIVLTNTNSGPDIFLAQFPTEEWYPPVKPVDPFKLQAIFLSARPSALIGGKTLFVGDQIANFHVNSIKADAVTLQSPAGQIKILALGK